MGKLRFLHVKKNCAGGRERKKHYLTFPERKRKNGPNKRPNRRTPGPKGKKMAKK